MTNVRRIAIIGAECVGKTELARQLAALLPGLWVPEYLREFCDRLRRTPLPHEQAHILGEQRRREDDAVAAAREQRLGWVLADSSPLVTAVYSELLFDDRALYAPAAEHHAVYAATLLLQPDLPWIADGIQRDGPAVRDASHALLLARLEELRLPYVAIGGGGSERPARALAALAVL
jgi:nicotinamide riboside kinase